MRKRIFYLLAIGMLVYTQAIAQHGPVKFEGRNFPEMFMDAKTFNKIVFVEVISSKNQACKSMDQSILSNPNLSAFLNDHFICKKIDTEANYTDVFSKNILSNTQTVPAFYFFDASQKALLIETGVKTAEELIQIGKRIKTGTLQEESTSPIIARSKDLHDKKLTTGMPLSTPEKEPLPTPSRLDIYLQLLSQQECLIDSTIYTIIDHESLIDSKGYEILSNPDSRVNAAIINGNPDLANEMYEAAIKIIRKSFSKACETRDRQLFERVLQENNRVMLDKREALRLSGKMIEVYNGGIVQN